MYESIFKAIGNEHIDYVRLFSRRTPQRYNPQAVNSDESKNVNYKIVTREEYFVNESVGGYTHSLFVKKGIVDDHQVSFPEKMVMLEDQVQRRSSMIISTASTYRLNWILYTASGFITGI